MRLGIAHMLKHDSPDDWAKKNRALGCSAVVFPVDALHTEDEIDAYARACRENDLLIAEVGAWSNPISPDEAIRKAALEKCVSRLAVAERIGARCCVNIAGAWGPRWDGGYKENYSKEAFDKIVRSIREIIDAVNPRNTYYTLEPMQWMLPDGPDSYLRLLDAVERDRFAVHLDIANMILCPERFFFNEEFMKECFTTLHGHIRSCHAKDIRLESPFTVHLSEVACGEGSLNIAEYARLAHEEDKDMPFIIEHLDNEEDYIKSAAYVRGVLQKNNIVMR